MNGVSIRFLTRLAHMARTNSEEIYLDRAGHPVPFFVYHSRAISRAAVLGHADVLRKYADEVAHRANTFCAAALEAAMPPLTVPATPAARWPLADPESPA